MVGYLAALLSLILIRGYCRVRGDRYARSRDQRDVRKEVVPAPRKGTHRLILIINDWPRADGVPPREIVLRGCDGQTRFPGTILDGESRPTPCVNLRLCEISDPAPGRDSSWIRARESRGESNFSNFDPVHAATASGTGEVVGVFETL